MSVKERTSNKSVGIVDREIDPHGIPDDDEDANDLKLNF